MTPTQRCHQGHHYNKNTLHLHLNILKKRREYDIKISDQVVTNIIDTKVRVFYSTRGTCSQCRSWGSHLSYQM